jgi:hypothetical protein
MSLTHINYNIFRGAGATTDTSSYVALNPRTKPGSLVLGVSIAAKESISSQVACKLGLEHFTDGVLDYYEAKDPQGRLFPISLEVLEVAFKKANSSVYQFAHKLAAGGRMASSLLGVVLEDKIIAAGKVGPGNVYLLRGGELFPFFETRKKDAQMPDEVAHESLIGAHSFVAVELASIPVEQGDGILIFPFPVSREQELEMQKLLREKGTKEDNTAAFICKHVFPDVYRIPFSACASLGPETIYLAEAV